MGVTIETTPQLVAGTPQPICHTGLTVTPTIDESLPWSEYYLTRVR